MKHYDYLIVGSGLYGATFAHLATHRGKKCMVIDRRPHLGGNLRCEEIEGITVHSYGPHIFHTSNKRVWDFVNSITPFEPFINMPLARYRYKLYNLPFNMNTFYQMWGCTTPAEAKCIIEQQRQEALWQMQDDGATEPRNLEEQALLLVGRDIYEQLIKGYTEKQWGRPCSELPAFIIRRLPVRYTFDNNYFNDRYQGIPLHGYNKLIEGLLEGSDTQTNADFFDNRSYWERFADNIVYTGPLDQYFGCQHGHLEWRSLHFENTILPISDYQGNAIVNYTDADVPYTRIIEHKHFVGSYAALDKTVITHEYPAEYTAGAEPYYPINDERNTKMAELYYELAKKETRVHFGGRLAEYKYYDMDVIVEKVLDYFK
jgi:UDP-galactopyranose mutase